MLIKEKLVPKARTCNLPNYEGAFLYWRRAPQPG
jgi:hypothetical protein